MVEEMETPRCWHRVREQWCRCTSLDIGPCPSQSVSGCASPCRQLHAVTWIKSRSRNGRNFTPTQSRTGPRCPELVYYRVKPSSICPRLERM